MPLFDEATSASDTAMAMARDGVERPDAVACDHACFAFDDHVVLRDVTFRIPQGSTRTMLGPSGSGKSVILRLILGLLRADSGTILSMASSYRHGRG
jgi:polar amino acid transport system ATP-binding protein